MSTLPTYFLSTAAAPWPFMMDQVGHLYGQLDASLRDIPRQVGVTPKAVLVITAHWEGRDFMLSSSPKPPMIYDYGGFPPHTYEVRYGAPGSPELAAQVKGLLDAGGFPAQLDAQRGFDHGTFSAMYPVYPDADVPNRAAVAEARPRSADAPGSGPSAGAVAQARRADNRQRASVTTTCAPSTPRARRPRTRSTTG